MIKQIQKSNLCDQLIPILINLIQKGEWESGQKLAGEIELANSFNVSRNIMREALKILETFGILEAKNGVGTFVSENAIENIQNMNFFYSLKNNDSIITILELRLMLEPEAAYFAALRISDEDIINLKKRSDKLLKKYSDNYNYQDDFDLHLAIAGLSGNMLCKNLCSSLLFQLKNSLYSEFNKYSSQKTREENLRTHNAIVEAIINHDAELARQLMRNHLLSRLQLINPDFEIFSDSE
ncbi:MAG: FadR/GntR family transcriptional regulator [Lachnospiraceae bacterium]